MKFGRAPRCQHNLFSFIGLVLPPLLLTLLITSIHLVSFSSLTLELDVLLDQSIVIVTIVIIGHPGLERSLRKLFHVDVPEVEVGVNRPIGDFWVRKVLLLIF